MKADVFHAYLSLLKQTRPAQSWLADPDAMEQGDTPLTMLQSQVSAAASAHANPSSSSSLLAAVLSLATGASVSRLTGCPPHPHRSPSS